MSEPPPPPAPPPPSPAPSAPPTAFSEPSRRWFLVGGVALVAAGGAGALAEWLGENTSPGPPRAPATLVAALQAERALIADLDATTGGSPAVRRVIGQARADHAEHLRILRRLLDQYSAPSGADRSRRRGKPRTLTELHQAELAAGAAAARHAAALEGPTAALLASIAACEVSHAELLR